jgi:hypothetical protein
MDDGLLVVRGGDEIGVVGTVLGGFSIEGIIYFMLR